MKIGLLDPVDLHSKKLPFFFLTGNRKIYYPYFNVIFTVYRIFT